MRYRSTLVAGALLLLLSALPADAWGGRCREGMYWRPSRHYCAWSVPRSQHRRHRAARHLRRVRHPPPHRAVRHQHTVPSGRAEASPPSWAGRVPLWAFVGMPGYRPGR